MHSDAQYYPASRPSQRRPLCLQTWVHTEGNCRHQYPQGSTRNATFEKQSVSSPMRVQINEIWCD